MCSLTEDQLTAVLLSCKHGVGFWMRLIDLTGLQTVHNPRAVLKFHKNSPLMMQTINSCALSKCDSNKTELEKSIALN